MSNRSRQRADSGSTTLRWACLALCAFGLATPASAFQSESLAICGADTACTQASAAIQRQADLAGIARNADERRRLIMSHQTPAGAAAMTQDEHRFRTGLADLLSGDRFEGRSHYIALEQLKGRWRSLDRMHAVADSVIGYWENSTGAVEIVRSVPGSTGVTFLRRENDASLTEDCRLESDGEPGGTALSFTVPNAAPLEFTVHDGALWVSDYAGDDACARMIARSTTYFSARPELHVPSPR